MSTQKERKVKGGTKEPGKKFQTKEEDKNISFKFYVQVLVLVITEKQIQLCKH